MSKSREMMSKSKKQKHDGAEKDPVVYFDPQCIPTKVWKSIFIHNSARDLLNLSLVCKKFYEIIGSLPEAMEKILVKQGRNTEKDINSLLNSTRHYRNFKFEDIQLDPDMEISLVIIRKFKEDLSSLEFCNSSFGKEINNILGMLRRNLRSLTINGLKLKETINNSEITASRTYKLTTLQNLKIRNYNETVLIKNVLDCAPDTLLELECDDFPDKSHFLKFLERQKNLEYLNLTSFNEDLLTKISIAEFKFKLKKLETFVPNSIKNNTNFGKFLKSQAESLKKLKLKNVSVLKFYDAFTNMPYLKLLKFEICEAINDQFASGPNFDCPALKTLKIYSDGNRSNLSYLNFFKRFVSIKKLVVKMKTNSNIMKIIAENHPNLKSLKLYKFKDTSFKSVSFKNLTKLEIYGASTEVNMENSVFAMEKLEILKIRAGFNVKMRSLLLILVNLKKLEHLEIDNGSSLHADSLCRHLKFFKNLRFLDIGNMPGPVKSFIKRLTVYPDLKYSLSNGSWKYRN